MNDAAQKTGTGGLKQETDEVLIRKVTVAGLVINILLSALKFVFGILGSSSAVTADAVHSLSDCTTDVAVLIGVKYWNKPPDECHPHGHHRIETAVTVFIGLALAGVAVGLVFNSLAEIHKQHSQHPSWIALCAAFISIVLKEVFYRWTDAVGKRVNSSAVRANAWHHRSDAFSSIPAALAVMAAILIPSWAFVDHVGAVVVSAFIFAAAWRIMRPAYNQLIDAGAPPKIRGMIYHSARTTPGVKQVHGIRTRYIGSGIQADLHIMVDGNMTVEEGHEISKEVKRRLIGEVPEVRDALIHLEPFEPSIFKEFMR